MNQDSFNQTFRNRTKKLAIAVINFCTKIPKTDASRIISRQLMRSVSSIGANFRATCVARSKRERYAKLCIVVEEADETLYWLEILEECDLNIFIPNKIKEEALEIAKVMSVSKTKVKSYLLRKHSLHNHITYITFI